MLIKTNLASIQRKKILHGVCTFKGLKKTHYAQRIALRSNHRTYVINGSIKAAARRCKITSKREKMLYIVRKERKKEEEEEKGNESV